MIFGQNWSPKAPQEAPRATKKRKQCAQMRVQKKRVKHVDEDELVKSNFKMAGAQP